MNVAHFVNQGRSSTILQGRAAPRSFLSVVHTKQRFAGFRYFTRAPYVQPPPLLARSGCAPGAWDLGETGSGKREALCTLSTLTCLSFTDSCVSVSLSCPRRRAPARDCFKNRNILKYTKYRGVARAVGHTHTPCDAQNVLQIIAPLSPDHASTPLRLYTLKQEACAAAARFSAAPPVSIAGAGLEPGWPGGAGLR